MQRLARLGVSVGMPKPAAPAAGPAGAAGAAGHPGRVPLEEALPGWTLSGPAGTCYVTDLRRGSAEMHGGEPLDGVTRACTESLAKVARTAGVRGVDLTRAVFVDTETTGLSGGAGTYAFLIGAGKLEGGSFVVRQFFMRNPSEEAAQLHAAADWMKGASAIVSFNGRAFDIPLLRMRFTMHRAPWQVAALPHVDLLHPARRLWRRRLPSCTLTALERHILGFHRQDDVPGWMIPERYFRFQRDGDARALVGIFRHNALDVLTMVSLVSRLARTYREPTGVTLDPQDWLSLARIYESDGERERGLVAWESAAARAVSADDHFEASFGLARAAKRAGAWDRSVALWRSLADVPAPRRVFPFIELAMYYEHKAKQLAPALAYARRALELVRSGRLRPYRKVTLERELLHRIGRLERKLARRAPADGSLRVPDG
jgi:uncharacterized protein YprB with RNaseH-like and TPR domain